MELVARSSLRLERQTTVEVAISLSLVDLVSVTMHRKPQKGAMYCSQAGCPKEVPTKTTQEAP